MNGNRSLENALGIDNAPSLFTNNMTFRRWMGSAAAVSIGLFVLGCSSDSPTPVSPPSPAPVVTANAYILPNAVSLNDFAFGDEPIVIFKGERLRWVNADSIAHDIVADSPDATDFRRTAELAPAGGQESFIMTRLGTTKIHCSDHPNMTGTLIVRER
jgi:plastocyanin